MSTVTLPPQAVEYPDSDGEPMADNTLQFRWIVTIQGGLDALFAQNPDVFVAGDLLWYPVQGKPTVRQAPDVMVAFGRPKGYRGSYRQWEEDGIPPQVVFEILSPGNCPGTMARKAMFYEVHGVEEYYLFDPDHNQLDGFLRQGELLEPIPEMNGWVSPRLKIRFDTTGEELRIIAPDGRQFATYVELAQSANQERERAEHERERAEQERMRAERLEAKLRAAGIEP
jgi:Uma2 family endonuclease